MRVSVLNQFAGRNTVGEEIQRLLAQQAFRRLRVLMAFCRGSGIGFMSRELTSFLERGGTAEAIIGLDMGGTSPEALEALIELGVTVHVFGVEGDRTFHPKVCIFDDGDGERYAALVGSANWTAGGLDSNFEAAVRVELRTSSAGDRRAAEELESLWHTYRDPAPPMTAAHLKRANRRFVHRLAERLGEEEKPAPDERSSDVTDSLFPPLSAPRRPIYRAPRTRRRRPPTPRTPARPLPDSLYLEVTGPETGQGREIQVPVDTLNDFFGIERDDLYYMVFRHTDGSEEPNRPLASYTRNSTFRISSAKFKEVPTAQRPIIVRLTRVHGATFNVTIIRRGTREYRAAEPHLTRGGGNSKRWGVL